MTQNERILRHLQDHGSITAAEAMREYGVCCLSSRIYELKAQGHSITREMETRKNRYGEFVAFARYRLEE